MKAIFTVNSRNSRGLGWTTGEHHVYITTSYLGTWPTTWSIQVSSHRTQTKSVATKEWE